MSMFAQDPETAERSIEAALNALGVLIDSSAAAAPCERTIRAMHDNAYLIIRQARSARREPVGIAAHMFCNYVAGLTSAEAWSPEGALLHHDAMRCLWSTPERAETDSILQGLLSLAQHHLRPEDSETPEDRP